MYYIYGNGEKSKCWCSSSYLNKIMYRQASIPPKVHSRFSHVTNFLCNAIFCTWKEK